MGDYRAAFKAACADLGAISALLGFESYPGVDALLRSITDLITANPPTGDAAGKDLVDAARDGFYLACFKDGRSRGVMTWWGPDNAGYTPYLEQAGVYTAEQIAADPSYYDSAHTVPVPVSFIDGRDSRQVDGGLSKNGEIFWSAKNLRAAIASLTKTADGENKS